MNDNSSERGYYFYWWIKVIIHTFTHITDYTLTHGFFGEARSHTSPSGSFERARGETVHRNW